MPDPNKLALVIGIDVYDDKNLDQLPACKKDAQGILNLLSSIDYTIFGERLIIGSNLDKENGWIKIRENIGNFFTRAKPSQTLLFYFSGHGILKGNELYLATPQIDTKDPATRGYSISELTNYVRDSNSRRIVCMIDSCYSGTVDLKMKSKAAKDEADNAKRLFGTSWSRIPKVKGSYLLLSSQSYEKSWAEDDNSIFTKYVIEGLKGVKPITDENGRYIEGSGSVDINGDVTPDSLHDYVCDKVNSITNQTPELKLARASKIVLAEYPDLAKIPQTPLLQIASSPGRIVSGEVVFRNDYLFENLHVFSAHNEVSGKSTAKIAVITQGSPDMTHDALKQLKVSQYLTPSAPKNYLKDESYTWLSDYATYICALLASPRLPNNFIGVAPRSEILLWDMGPNGKTTDILLAMDKAIAEKCQVMLIPLAFMGGKGDYGFWDSIAESAMQAGITVVAPSGNIFETGNEEVGPVFPAISPNVISVAAINSDDIASDFSSYHKVDICAYGVEVASAIQGNKWMSQNGTHAASCFVAGAIALMYSLHPKLTPEEVRRIISETGENIDHKNEEYKGKLGAGRLNVFAALRAVKGTK